MAIDTALTTTGASASTEGTDTAGIVREHISVLGPTLASLEAQSGRLAAWGRTLAERLHVGSRLLVGGNGGSAAEAQHLTAEIVGRFENDRRPFAAIALNADTSTITAVGNDYGFEQVFARQVLGHGRPGDIVLLLSTSGSSPNLVRAAEACHRIGARAWAITGPGPNPLTEACDESITLTGSTSSVQEAELVAIHALCRTFEHALAEIDARHEESTR